MRAPPLRVDRAGWSLCASDEMQLSGCANVDYSAEPMTLVTFELAEAPGGTQLRIVESGFDAIPAARRATARLKNDEGWTEQARNIARYLHA
jgi:hypothetical protein